MNSVLNPEAPEFYPQLTAVTQRGYTAVNKTIRSSNQLPTGTSYNNFKSLTDFNIITCKLSKNVISQSNQLIKTELPSVNLKLKDIDFNMEKIVDANDYILDHINTNIDTVCSVNNNSKKLLESINKHGINVSSWNKNAPIIAKIQMGSTTFIGAKNIPRPQLTFKDTIDNSESMWVPKISDKPNSIKPLALNILYNEEGDAIGYEHPYKVELDLYHPPAQFLEPDLSPLQDPLPLEATKLTFIDTEAQLDELIKHLTEVKEMAVDVEHHSYRTYQGITCLIQITGDTGNDYIIDALAIREHIHKLNLVFTDPKKLKVFHGAEMDILWLQRDFGLYVVGLFDTHKAAKVLNLSGLSLKHLLMKYCQVESDKKYQLADWRIRPLPEELMQYAQMDTHYLLYIWRKMKSDLLKAGLGQPHLLLSVFEQSRQICGTTYNKEVIHDNSHMPLYRRSKKSFNSQQMAALQRLYKWRDAQARLLDESTTYLLPNHMLLSLAEMLPRELQGVTACCSPMPPFVKQNLVTIHRMILTCRELPVEPQLYQMPSSIRSMVDTTHHQIPTYDIHDFSQFPDFREDNINLEYAVDFTKESNEYKADIEIFTSTDKNDKLADFSNLNAEAKLFIPPYDRYRKYRSIAQLEEIKELREKEAKLEAISKTNTLMNEKNLTNIQAKTQLENTEEAVKFSTPIETDIATQHKAEKRKRKISTETVEEKKTVETSGKIEKVNLQNNSRTSNKNVNTFSYKNHDYKKFHNDKLCLKPSKMKFKKT